MSEISSLMLRMQWDDYGAMISNKHINPPTRPEFFGGRRADASKLMNLLWLGYGSMVIPESYASLAIWLALCVLIELDVHDGALLAEAFVKITSRGTGGEIEDPYTEFNPTTPILVAVSSWAIGPLGVSELASRRWVKWTIYAIHRRIVGRRSVSANGSLTSVSRTGGK
jgi:hypothetical protein